MDSSSSNRNLRTVSVGRPDQTEEGMLDGSEGAAVSNEQHSLSQYYYLLRLYDYRKV